MTRTENTDLLALDLVELEATLRAARAEATSDYVNRGVDAYLDRGALRGDLCLLIAASDRQRAAVPLTLAELNGLECSGLMGPNSHTLTVAGRHAAIAAAITNLSRAALDTDNGR